MQRLKNYPKRFCLDQQRFGGGGAIFRFCEGGHIAHGGSPQFPPLGKTLGVAFSNPNNFRNTGLSLGISGEAGMCSYLVR